MTCLCRTEEPGRVSEGEAEIIKTRREPFSEVSGGCDRPSERDLDRVVLNVVCHMSVRGVDVADVAGLARMKGGPVFERDLGWVVFDGIPHCPYHCCLE